MTTKSKILAAERRYPFAAAALAAGVTEKRLRNWLDRELIYLNADDQREESGKHRRFSALDILRIALVSRLTTYGLTAEGASVIVEDLLGRGLNVLRTYKNAPFAAIVAYLQVQIAMITCEDGEYRWDVIHAFQSVAGREDWNKKTLEEGPVDFLIIKLGAIAEDVAAGLTAIESVQI